MNPNPFNINGQNYYFRQNPIGVPLGGGGGAVVGSGYHFWVIFRDYQVTAVGGIPHDIDMDGQVIKSAAITRFVDSPNWIRLFQCGSGTTARLDELYLSCVTTVNQQPIVLKLTPVNRFDFSIEHGLHTSLNEIVNIMMDLYVYTRCGHELFVEMWKIEGFDPNNYIEPNGPADTTLFGGGDAHGVNVERALRSRLPGGYQQRSRSAIDFDDIDEMLKLQLRGNHGNQGNRSHVHLYIIMFHVINEITKGVLKQLPNLNGIPSGNSRNDAMRVADVISRVFGVKNHMVWLLIWGFCQAHPLQFSMTQVGSVMPQVFRYTWVRHHVGDRSYNYMVVFENVNNSQNSGVKIGAGVRNRIVKVSRDFVNYFRYRVVNVHVYSSWLNTTSSKTDDFWMGIEMQSLGRYYLSDQVRLQTTVSHIVEFLLLATHFMYHKHKPIGVGNQHGKEEVMWWDSMFVSGVCGKAFIANIGRQPGVLISTIFPEEIKFVVK